MVKNVAVIGMGRTGSILARLLALAGFQTTVRDLSGALLEATLADIKDGFARMVQAGRLGAKEAEEAQARLFPEVVLERAVIRADLVFEALPDNLELKKELFLELDHLCPPTAVLVTTTAIHSVSEIAAVTKRPEQCLGMHWLGDPQITSLVEIVRGFRTASVTLDLAKDVAGRMRQDFVEVEDREGFVGERAWMALLLECARMAEEGVASIEDIDRTVLGTLGVSPLSFADTIGLEKVFQSASRLTEAYGDRFIPPQNLVVRVKTRQLGKSTGGGFFRYGD